MSTLSSKTISTYLLVLISFLLFALTLLTYAPSLQNGFVWDDEKYILENTHIHSLNAQSVHWMLTSSHASNWHPLTWFSHSLDYTLWGPEPGRHHLINTIFHGLNTSLVFFIIITILSSIKSAWLQPLRILTAGTTTSLLFALHPLHVESVAWAAERKDLLSAFFFLASLLAYLWYTSPASPKQKAARFALCLFLFVLALMSKPMAVSLPLILLLLDYYPLKRFTQPASKYFPVLLEKIPFLILSIASSIITVIAQRAGGSIHSLEQVSISYRLLNAMWAITHYLNKIVLPFNLVPFYPFTFHPYAAYLLPATTILLVTTLCVGAAKKRHYFWLVAWLYFLVTLLPVLGIIQVGGQAAADRYTYLPSLSPFFLAGLGIAWIIKKGSLVRLKSGFFLLAVFSLCATIFSLGYLTRTQIGVWKTPETLWKCVIRAYPETPVAHYNLGTFYGKTDNLDKAVFHLKKAIAFDPDYKEAHNNLGTAYFKKGKLDEAILEYKREIAINPRYAATHNNLGIVYYSKGLLDDAAAFYKKAITLDPRSAQTHHNLGTTHQRKGEIKKAIASYKQAIAIDPTLDMSHHNMGTIYAKQGKLKAAVKEYKIALSLNPSFKKAADNLDRVLVKMNAQ
jgi:tetratricopeptide (TPR) repeat protein